MKMIKITEIERGDIVTYRDGSINYVNKLWKYHKWFSKDFENMRWDVLAIVKVQRYVKCLWFYRLKTIYKRRTK